jgi:MFS family permease
VTRLERVLLISTAALSASNSVIFALIASLQDEYGFSDAGLGIIAATGFAMSFLVQLFVSPLADRGHTKRLLLLGTVLSVVGNLVFATGGSLIQFATGRALVGAAFGCFAPAARALIASMSTQNAAQRLGRISAAELAGFAVGPAVGGALAGPLGLRWPFVVFGACAVAAFIMLTTLHIPTVRSQGSSQKLAFDLLRNRQVLVAVLLCLSLALPVGLYDALWGKFLQDLGAEEWLVGLSLTTYALPFVLLASAGGRLADRRGAIPVAMAGLWLVAPLTATYGLFSVPAIPIALGTAEAVAQAAANPAAWAALAAAAPAGRSSAAQGLAGAVMVAMNAIIALVASVAYGVIGARTLFIIAGGSIAALGFVTWVLHKTSAAPTAPPGVAAEAI